MKGIDPLRFGVFEVDLAVSELRRNGRRVRLQEQPFQILCALLERPGELVTREDLRARLWPADVNVDFERGLNKAVLKLRDALGDSAENPRFIETVPRRGYRFIAPTSASSEPAALGDVPGESARSTRHPWLRFAMFGLGALVAIAVASRLLPRTERRQPLVRFTVRLPPGLGFAVYYSASIAVSHDGTRVAYAARGRGHDGGGVYVRALEGLEVRQLPDTEGARSPFFSADDAWIGFETGQKLKMVAATGGTPRVLLDLPFPAGATSFGREGKTALVPSFTGGLFELDGKGGRPRRLTTPDLARGEGAHIWPASLPGGRGLLMSVWSPGARSYDESRIAVLPTGARTPRTVLEGGYGARYAPSGHLVFLRGGALHAAPFDLDTLRVTGSPTPVVPGVLADASSGAALYDVSPAGTLAYVPGQVETQSRRLVLVDRKGAARTVGEGKGAYVSPRLSPDGRRIALWIENVEAEVWTLDRATDALSRLTVSGDNHSPAWAPDGRTLAFESGRSVMHQIYLRSADGTGRDRAITAGDAHHYLSDWSKDGRLLAYTEFHPETRADVWITGPEAGSIPRPIVRTPFSEKEAVFSPDGRFIAYVSDESGRFEVYAASLADLASRWRISSAGGEEPAFSPDGRELFYRHGRQFLAVPLHVGERLEPGRPLVLFEGSYHDNIAPTRSYDVTPDGRFLMVTEPVGDELPQELTVVLGWAEELKGVFRAR